MERILCLIITGTLLLAGCGRALQTPFVTPDVTIPARWNATAGVNGTEAPGVAAGIATDIAAWPKGFGDPELEQLVTLMLQKNNDLAAAAFRVRQARLKAGQAFDDLLPDLSGTGSSEHVKNTKERGGDWANTYSATLGVSYEADLWGRLSRLHDAAEWEAVATEEDRRSTALSLVGTTMKLYWQIAYDNVRLQLSEQNIEYAKTTLELMEAKEKYGVASELETNEARQDVAALSADRQSLLQERQENINALAVLFDMPPGKVMASPQQLTTATLPPLPAGIPAELLARRPDLRAAELRLREMLANTDAARASFYPSLTLSGSLGSSGTQLTNMMNNPVATLASSLVLPFLNWNTLQLNLKVSRAEYDEAVVNFRQTLYEAMVEVENALSSRRTLALQGQHLEEKLAAARKVESVYEVRYRVGAGTLKDWLDSQNTRRSAEDALAENLYNRLTNYVTLYQALGGEPAPAPTSEDAVQGTTTSSRTPASATPPAPVLSAQSEERAVPQP